MKILRQKIFFERTKEMDETIENFNKAKKKVKSVANKVLEKVKDPEKTFEEGKEYIKNKAKKISNKISEYRSDPGILKEDLKSAGKKTVKFIKENPRDAVYLGSSYFVIPPVVNKVVSRYKGPAAGKAAMAVAAGLPIGEALVGADHFARSKAGKTALKAGGQVIKGIGSDIRKKFTRSKQ